VLRRLVVARGAVTAAVDSRNGRLPAAPALLLRQPCIAQFTSVLNSCEA
jgi:hypothetical protein